jgi:hypothetical protein
MKFTLQIVGVVTLLAFGLTGEASARGFGAVHAGVAVGPAGIRAGVSAGGVGVGPVGGVGVGGVRGGTFVGAGGTTVQAGRVGGVGVGPLGGVHAGVAQGVRVTTPGGRTFASGSAGGIGVGPLGGVRAGSVGGAAFGGPYGGAVVGRVGGVGVVGHATGYIGPNVLATRGAYVRGGFGYNCFTPVWYRAHPVAWVAPRWRVANYWGVPAWSSVGLWCGINAPPIYYDYGSNFVIQDNYVYIDGEQVSTAAQYADQALAFADAGRQARLGDTDEWQPLGVFGMIQGEETTAQRIFQLAVNSAGIIRGNYYDAVADNTLPVYGSVDPGTQRVAWSVGDKRSVVFETGLSNLTQPQTTVLVHYGNERTDQVMLVHLDGPADQNR